MNAATQWKLCAMSIVMLCPSLVSAQPAPISQPNHRLTVVISDLHMGVGQDAAAKNWRPMEDFRWQEEFVLFLKQIDVMGKGTTNLILNGDTFELWESGKDDCLHAQKELGCTEDEALSRIQTVLTAHKDELKSLGQFANSGENQVVIVPGNHDAALLFDTVKRAVLAAIPSKPGRVQIPKEGYWRTTDGLLYVEHGHQIGKTPDKDNWSWPSPFLTVNGKKHLQRSKDERTLQAYVNRYEKDVPIVDNTPEQEAALRVLLATEHAMGTSHVADDIFGLFLLKSIWKDLADMLGDQSGQPPVWDVKAIRKTGGQFFVDSIPSDDPLRTIVEDAQKQGVLGQSIDKLTDDEIIALCDQRAITIAMQKEEIKKKTRTSVTIQECDRKGDVLGAAADNLLRSRNNMFTAHLEKTRATLNTVGLPSPQFLIFVHGATHMADSGFKMKIESWSPRVVDSGTWQRVAMKRDLDKLRAKPDRNNLTDQEFLRSVKLEELPACYSAILVEPYTDKPEPTLRYWIKGEGGVWRFNNKCQ